jgi:hypothetical protein
LFVVFAFVFCAEFMYAVGAFKGLFDFINKLPLKIQVVEDSMKFCRICQQ